MGFNGKNLTAQICQLLMEITEQENPRISHPVLVSEIGQDIAKFLIDQNYLIPGRNLDTYWLGGDEDIDVEWNEELQSFAYLSCGKFIAVKEDHLKTFNINFTKLNSFLAQEFDVFESSKIKENQYLNGFLFFIGQTKIDKRNLALFFARRLNDNQVLRKVEEFFIQESITPLPKLILTSSNQYCPSSLKNIATIISIPKLLTRANNQALFNIDYIAHIIFGMNNQEARPHIYCTKDGGTLFIGDKSWNIKGDKQRQIIKIMCDHYLSNPQEKIRWNNVLSIADLDSSNSRYRDVFKDSAVKEAICHGNGFVWFKNFQ